MIAAVSVAQTTVSIATSLRSQSYNHLADEAAQAGVSYAYSCLKKNSTNYWTSSLKPNTSCTGSANSNSVYLEDNVATTNSSRYRSSFSVSVPDTTSHQATVHGTVELVDTSGTITKTWVSDKVVVINITTTITGFSAQSLAKASAWSNFCGISGGKAYCWGLGTSGQLGNGSTSSSSVPVAVNTSGVLNNKAITAISAGNGTTCAAAEGKAYCWGAGYPGQLGNGSTANSSVPVAVTTSGVLNGKTVTAVSAGGYNSCVIADGQAYCWGQNNYGQLGNGTTTDSTVPVAVNTSGVLSGKTITAIVTSYYRTCALANGAVYCWGYNANGQLGNNSTTNSSVPVAVYTGGALSGKSVTAVASGLQYSCAIASGNAYCWGYNNQGQLGNNSTTQSNIPVAVNTSGVLSGNTVTAISTGYQSTCVLASSQPYCWGYGVDGELGNGASSTSYVPVAVSTSGVLSGKAISELATGNFYSCVIAGGAAYCWGYNADGELGNGTTTSSSVPVAVSAPGS